METLSSFRAAHQWGRVATLSSFRAAHQWASGNSEFIPRTSQYRRAMVSSLESPKALILAFYRVVTSLRLKLVFVIHTGVEWNFFSGLCGYFVSLNAESSKRSIFGVFRLDSSYWGGFLASRRRYLI